MKNFNKFAFFCLMSLSLFSVSVTLDAQEQTKPSENKQIARGGGGHGGGGGGHGGGWDHGGDRSNWGHGGDRGNWGHDNWGHDNWNHRNWDNGYYGGYGWYGGGVEINTDGVDPYYDPYYYNNPNNGSNYYGN